MVPLALSFRTAANQPRLRSGHVCAVCAAALFVRFVHDAAMSRWLVDSALSTLRGQGEITHMAAHLQGAYLRRGASCTGAIRVDTEYPSMSPETWGVWGLGGRIEKQRKEGYSQRR